MNTVDIITRLKQIVPRHTSLFCDELDVTSLDFYNATGLVTCTCSTPHGLSVGDEVFIAGALTPITINSITRVDAIATAVTNSNHDLTLGFQETVTLTGAAQEEYNGSHALVDVRNRRTFSFSVTGSPSTPATGTIKMTEDIKAGYNGLHIVNNLIDTYKFTYAITSTPESPALGTIKLRKELAITGDVTMERFLESYSKQEADKFYMVVVLGGAFASKDRFTLSDALSTSTASAVDARIRIIDPFSIFIVTPASNTLTAMTIRDGMDYMSRILNKSILFHTFPTGAAFETNLGVTLVGHDMHMYDVSKYIHEFKYEFVYDLVREDGVDDFDSVAFRDIDLHFNSYLNSKHNELMTSLVNLDDHPL